MKRVVDTTVSAEKDLVGKMKRNLIIGAVVVVGAIVVWKVFFKRNKGAIIPPSMPNVSFKPKKEFTTRKPIGQRGDSKPVTQTA